MAYEIEIAGRKIGPNHRPYVICELSANHQGRLERALQLIDAAAATGADAVKIQTYTADTITIDSNRPEFKLNGGLWDGRTLYDLYREAETPYEWHAALFDRAAQQGVTLLSTPFDTTAVDLLAGLNVPAYKIASFEVVDLPLIAYAARQGKPLIISTGMANLGEISEAVAVARAAGAGGIALLHCTSSYPAGFEDVNAATIPHLGAAFQCVSGLSDHTPGTAAAVASVVLGASIVEKHFTLSRADGGPDAAFSLEPDEFARLVQDCRAAWLARGSVNYDLLGSERGNVLYRRSLYIVEDVPAGATLTQQNVRSIRPGCGLPPRRLPEVLGKRSRRDLKRGEPLTVDMFE